MTPMFVLFHARHKETSSRINLILLIFFNNTTALGLRFELPSTFIVKNTEYEYKTEWTKNEPF